jgi:FAD synthase
VFSIGPPLQYDIKEYFYEVLILQKFPVEEFYGLKLKSSVNGFIRPMAKFENFDSFIKAMWNDIHAATLKLKMDFGNYPKL